MRYKVKQGKGVYEKIRQKMEIYRARERVQEKRGIEPYAAGVFEKVEVPTIETEVETEVEAHKAE